MLKLKMMALHDDVAASGRRQLPHQASLSSRCVKPPPPAWMTSPRLADTAEQDYLLTLRERLITLCKNNWKEPRSILMSSADELPISMGSSLHSIVSNTHGTSSGSINA